MQNGCQGRNVVALVAKKWASAAPYDRPEVDGDAVGLPYKFLDATLDVDTILYLECRELPGDGAVLATRFVTSIDDYDQVLPEWLELPEGVEIVGEEG